LKINGVISWILLLLATIDILAWLWILLRERKISKYVRRVFTGLGFRATIWPRRTFIGQLDGKPCKIKLSLQGNLTTHTQVLKIWLHGAFSTRLAIGHPGWVGFHPDLMVVLPPPGYSDLTIYAADHITAGELLQQDEVRQPILQLFHTFPHAQVALNISPSVIRLWLYNFDLETLTQAATGHWLEVLGETGKLFERVIPGT